MAGREVRDRYLGAILGLLSGDAVGTPLTGHPRFEIAQHHADLSRMVPGPKTAAGQWTMSGSQAFDTLESVIACKGFEGEDIALRLVEISDRPHVDFDPHTLAAINAVVEDPEAWESCGLEPWYTTGGTFCTASALPRATVVALAEPNDLHAMVENTIRICRITHVDPRCIDACLALNFTLIQLLHGRFSADLPHQARQFLVSVKQETRYRALALGFDRERLRNAPADSFHRGYLEEEHAILGALEAIPHLDYDQLGNTDYVVHTLQTALWCMLKAQSPEEAIRRAVNLGGATSLNGAMAGALSGARFGFGGLPSAWLTALEQRAKAATLAEILASEVESGFAG